MDNKVMTVRELEQALAKIKNKDLPIILTVDSQDHENKITLSDELEAVYAFEGDNYVKLCAKDRWSI